MRVVLSEFQAFEGADMIGTLLYSSDEEIALSAAKTLANLCVLDSKLNKGARLNCWLTDNPSHRNGIRSNAEIRCIYKAVLCTGQAADTTEGVRVFARLFGSLRKGTSVLPPSDLP